VPELPEVEVTKAGLAPRLTGRRICSVSLSGQQLRHPLPQNIDKRLRDCRIERVGRRAKYLLIHLSSNEVLVWHLGMTGRFHVVDAAEPPLPHQHVAITLDDGKQLRYVDPRRFGYAGLVAEALLPAHPWFAHLGPEPLEEAFDSEYLYRACRRRSAPIKNVLMDASVVVGVGNIYASESLYRAGIRPTREAGKIAASRIEKLASAVKAVLSEAIAAGGSTIRDFAAVDGKPGYFAYSFQVYGRDGEDCGRCGKRIQRIVQAGRSTFYCAGCQR